MIKAKYTVVLDTLLKDENVKPLIDQALSTYPIYTRKSTEKYIPSFVPTRESLNQKLLNYYRFREIGFESVGRFLSELEYSMNEIMSYYNQILVTLDQDFQIIYNVDYTNEHTMTTEGKEESETTSQTSGNSTNNVTDETTSSSTLGNDNKTVNTKTPQSQISVPASDIDSVDYADEVNWSKGNNTENGTSNGTSTATTENTVNGNGTGVNNIERTEQFNQRIFGNYGQVSYQSLIRQYRENIINVEQQIINNSRISELFMLIY